MRHSGRTQTGFTLIEIMVGMAIGLVVVGSVLAAYLSSSRVQLAQTAHAQMDEDAQTALRVLSSELMLAGYSEPSGIAPGSLQRLQIPNAIQECGGVPGGNTGACDGTPPTQIGPSSLVVSYQATTRNTLLSDGSPSDCLGYSLAGTALAVNRYFPSLSSGHAALQCQGNSVGTDGKVRPSAPVVSNIEGLMFWYGQADDIASRQVVRYVRAAQLNTSTGLPSPFDSVVSVRLCVLVRSAEPVPVIEGSVSQPYLDCEQNPQVSADRRLRRAYFMTIALRNRTPF